ncbi:MAG: 50S ribosomal protein L11 methyltransferase [Zoogloeaceae bacterium]|jgi:ribosomal protein L11 methyltransferase|nr:50S ribosomal protein L11 methyltransferase [Zoogloeaceae bacterium]
MAWINASFVAGASLAEVWCDALLMAGAISASVEDADAGTPAETPQFGEPGMENTPLWQNARISALFPEDSDILPCFAAISAQLHCPSPQPLLTRIEEENWVRLTQAQFEPIRVSSRLWIVPSWHEAPDPAALNIVLDPGMAFGTGSHPTTQLCLEWLEREVRPGMSLLDYGCGSGILAIVAAKLGAMPVHGLDIDPQAVFAARVNAQKNAVDIQVTETSESLLPRYDLVVANILANPLRLLAPAISARLRPGGRLALSGLLPEQAETIAEFYSAWILFDQSNEREGWVCLSGQKRDNTP